MSTQTSSNLEHSEKRAPRWKWRTPAQIAEAMLEVDRRVAAGESIEAISMELGINASTYHRWRSLYQGLNAEGIAYTKRLESEVRRLRKIINEFEVDAPLTDSPFLGSLA